MKQCIFGLKITLMRIATLADKTKIVDIITKTFETNPGVLWMFNENDKKLSKKVRRLAEFAFEKSLARGGAYISDDENGAALCYPANTKASLREMFFEYKFALSSIPVKNFKKVMWREKVREGIRPKDHKYLYFWFLGVQDSTNGAVHDLRKGIFNLAKEKQMPIVLETSVPRNKMGYERYGFELFHHWVNEEKNINLYFMRLDP